MSQMLKNAVLGGFVVFSPTLQGCSNDKDTAETIDTEENYRFPEDTNQIDQVVDNLEARGDTFLKETERGINSALNDASDYAANLVKDSEKNGYFATFAESLFGKEGTASYQKAVEDGVNQVAETAKEMDLSKTLQDNVGSLVGSMQDMLKEGGIDVENIDLSRAKEALQEQTGFDLKNVDSNLDMSKVKSLLKEQVGLDLDAAQEKLKEVTGSNVEDISDVQKKVNEGIESLTGIHTKEVKGATTKEQAPVISAVKSTTEAKAPEKQTIEESEEAKAPEKVKSEKKMSFKKKLMWGGLTVSALFLGGSVLYGKFYKEDPLYVFKSAKEQVSPTFSSLRGSTGQLADSTSSFVKDTWGKVSGYFSRSGANAGAAGEQ